MASTSTSVLAISSSVLGSEASTSSPVAKVIKRSPSSDNDNLQYLIVGSTAKTAPPSNLVAASALQLLASGGGDNSTRRELLIRQPSYCKILDDLRDVSAGGEDTVIMAKSEASAEVSTSADGESGSNSVQTITINGQQYQIVSPSALEGAQSAASSSGATSSSAAAASGVLQYTAASQNGQTVFIPGTVTPGASSPQVITVTGSHSPSGGGGGGGGHQGPEEQVRKREVRLMKNREAARECRNKKKEYIKCLENRVAVLENQNKALIEELKSLKELYTGQKS